MKFFFKHWIPVTFDDGNFCFYISIAYVVKILK